VDTRSGRRPHTTGRLILKKTVHFSEEGEKSSLDTSDVDEADAVEERETLAVFVGDWLSRARFVFHAHASGLGITL